MRHAGGVRRALHLILILKVRVIVQWRHLRRESIDWPAKLIKGLIITVLAATLPPMSLAIVALKGPVDARAVLWIIHRPAVHAC